MHDHTIRHLLGAAVLYGVSPHLPSADQLVAALAATGLLLSGLAQVVKQAVELYKAGGPPAKPQPPAAA